MTNLPAYPAYKPIVGGPCERIPAHWKVRSLGSMALAISLKGRTDLPLLSVARERGVFQRSMTGEDSNHNVIPEDLSGYKVAPEGSLVINKMKAWQGSMGLAPCDGVVSPAYYVYRLEAGYPPFIERLFRSKPYVYLFAKGSDGIRIGQWDLSIPRMKAIPVILPPPDEQVAIVRYLDHVTARLGRAMTAKREVIRLLEEQKQAVIASIVTRGLREAVRLKDTHLPWLGKVPQHWDVLPLKRVATILPGYAFPSAEFQRGILEHRLLRGVNVSVGKTRWDDVAGWKRRPCDGLDRYVLRPGDIVLGMDRPVVGGGVRVAVLSDADLPALLLQRVAKIAPNRKLLPAFLTLLISGRPFQEYIAPLFSGISVPHMSAGQIGQFVVPIPDVEDQNAIVQALNERCSRVDESIERIEREISLMDEYRTTLIAEVTTGKCDVRVAAAALPPLGSQEETSCNDEMAEALLEEVAE